MLIINYLRKTNLSLGIRVNALMPEAGRDVGETVVRFGGGVVSDFVKTLVRGRGIERAEMLHIWSDLDIIESHVESPLYIPTSRIKRRRKPDLPDMVRQSDQSLRIIALAKEKETIDSEIISDKLVYDLVSQLLPYILLQER